MPDSREPPPPRDAPTDRERLAYVAEVVAELRSLVAEPRFRTVAYLLDMARLEADRAAKALPE